LRQRVERLMNIPAIGPITALTWALEVGDVQRFSSISGVRCTVQPELFPAPHSPQ
jgi:transposase